MAKDKFYVYTEDSYGTKYYVTQPHWTFKFDPRIEIAREFKNYNEVTKFVKSQPESVAEKLHCDEILKQE